MIKILIIDDNPRKVSQIRECLVQASVVIENIETVSDIVEGKKKLRNKLYDILILDVQLPERTGDKPLTDGGLEILRLIHDTNRYKRPNYIIGLSEFDNYRNNFEDKLHLLIKFDEKTDDWQIRLTNQVSEVNSSKFNIAIPDYYFDVGFVCALEDIELENILKLDANWERVNIPSDNLIYYTGSLLNNEGYLVKLVAVSCEQMGMSAAAVATTKLIHHFRPKYIFMTGVAGAIEGNLKFGDIIIADPCWDYGDGKFIDEDGGTRFEDSPYQLRAPINLLSYINRLRTTSHVLDEIRSNYKSKLFIHSLSVYIAPFVSGSAVIATSEKREKYNLNIVRLPQWIWKLLVLCLLLYTL